MSPERKPTRAARSSLARALLLATALGAGACRELSLVEEDVCGNRVTEPAVGEECDGQPGCEAPGQPFACRYRCTPAREQADVEAADRLSCPSGMGCGVDGVCRAPTGSFTELASGSDSLFRGALAVDLEGDGCAELVLATRTGSSVRSFGSRALGACDAGEQTLEHRRPGVMLTPAPEPRALDLDGDGTSELVAPVDGSVELGTGLGTYLVDDAARLTPAIHPLDRLARPNARVLRARLLARDALVTLAGEPGELPSGPPAMPDPSMITGSCGGSLPPGASLSVSARLAPDAPFVALGELSASIDGLVAYVARELDPSGDDCDELVTAHAGDDRVRVWRLCAGGALTLAPLGDVMLDGGARVRSRNASVELVDLDLDGALDLVLNASDAALHVAYGRPDGAFHSAPGPVATPDGRTSELPAPVPELTSPDALFVAGDFTGGPEPELVPVGCPGGAPFTSPLCAPLASPCQALTVDVDADGDLDIVSIAANQPDVTVRRVLDDGTLHVSVLPTRCPPFRLAAGDFDGDGVDDLAFYDQDPSTDGAPATTIEIAYGVEGGVPLAPARQGRLASATDLAAGRFEGSAMGLAGDPRSELYAVAGHLCGEVPEGASLESVVSLASGGSERALRAPLYLPSDGVPAPRDLRALATGPFGGAARPGIALLVEPSEATAPELAELFLLEGSASRLEPTSAGLVECERCVAAALAAPAEAARLVLLGDGALDVFARDDDGVLTLVHTQALTRSYASLDLAGNPPRPAPPALVADLDGDGALDLLARATDGALVALFSEGEGFVEVGLREPSCAEGCPLAAALAELDGDEALELLVLEGHTLEAYELPLASRAPGAASALELGGLELGATLGGPLVSDVAALEAADFDGDGVTDLALLTSSAFFVVLRGTPVRE